MKGYHVTRGSNGRRVSSASACPRRATGTGNTRASEGEADMTSQVASREG
jgi:hypothetical protein